MSYLSWISAWVHVGLGRSKMFGRPENSSCLMAFVLLGQSLLPSLNGGVVRPPRADEANSGQTALAGPSPKVSVCVPQDLVRQGWDHPAPGSKMSSFKDLLAEFILAHGDPKVQYRVKQHAFDSYDPAAQLTPYARPWMDEVSAGPACPASTEAYEIKVAAPASAATPANPVASALSNPRQYDAVAQKCNELAADPGDPNRVGAGVPFDQINLAEALPACERAAARQPVIPRYAYLYGLVLKAAKRYPEAAKQFAIGAQAGDPLAAIDLAGLYFEGRGVSKDYEQAARFCRQSADAGVPGAAYHLGFLYREGLGVPKDYTEAANYYIKAGDGGFPDAYAEAGRLYILGTPQDFAKAAAWFQKAVEKKSSLGGLNLGFLYEYGPGVRQDLSLAANLYYEAAQQGNTDAMYRLGLFYQKGTGVQRDDRAAANWLYEAAKQGHAPAQDELGYMFYNGLGTKQDYQGAFAWYIQAAQAGVVNAQDSVACMYELGRGITQNDAEAVAWFRKAAERNDPFAMTQLAVHLRQGSGVAWNEAEARQWFRKAADQGYATAQTSLGYGYMAGLGQDAGQGKQDYREAAHWFTQAAQQGEPFAQLDLAILYERGWGVTQDLQKAKSLYLQAASGPNPEVAKNARELVSSGPFVSSASGTSSRPPSPRSQEDWVGPVVGIAVTVAGVAALLSFLSGPSSGTRSTTSSGTDVSTSQRTDYTDYVGQAIQDNIARETAARETAAQEDHAKWERSVRCGNYHLADCN